MRKGIIRIVICFAGCIAGMKAYSLLLGLIGGFPIGVKAVIEPLGYWLAAAVPIIVMLLDHVSLEDIGWDSTGYVKQILTGVLIAAVFAGIVLIIYLTGLGETMDPGYRITKNWVFAWNFIKCIFAVGAVEELVFRGVIYYYFKTAFQKENAAVWGSSVLFGLMHLLSGNVFTAIGTMCIGLIYCLLKNRIRNCSLLSLMIAHGIHDAMIDVFASVFL